jgi:hypothetical protein
MEMLTPLNTRDISSTDIINHHKKVVLDKYMRQRIERPSTKVSQIVKDLGVSSSTITRYGHDLGIPKRSTRALSQEQKSDIKLKAAYTKRLNHDYKQKLSELSSSQISTEEFSRRALELKQNVTNNRNQFRQQLSEQSSSLGVSSIEGSSSAVQVPRRKRGGVLGTLGPQSCSGASAGGRRAETHGIQTYDHEVTLTPEDQALYDKMKARG